MVGLWLAKPFNSSYSTYGLKHSRKPLDSIHSTEELRIFYKPPEPYIPTRNPAVGPHKIDESGNKIYRVEVEYRKKPPQPVKPNTKPDFSDPAYLHYPKKLRV